MQTSEEASVLKCNNIVISTRGLAEVDGKKIILFVPKDEVNQITLKYGKAEHNPIISLVIGIILALVGLAGLVELILAPRGLRYELGMMFFGFIGGSLLFDSMKQRYFFEILRIKGRCRLVFSKKTTLPEIRDFCQKVQTTYNYKVLENL
jgi:hypothetical protein